jgi:hypothetical protein
VAVPWQLSKEEKELQRELQEAEAEHSKAERQRLVQARPQSAWVRRRHMRDGRARGNRRVRCVTARD